MRREGKRNAEEHLFSKSSIGCFKAECTYPSMSSMGKIWDRQGRAWRQDGSIVWVGLGSDVTATV